MSLVRAGAAAFLSRWSEVGVALAVCLGGASILRLGGYIPVVLGSLIVALGLGWAIVALRRLRFVQSVTAAGVIEVDEGQVGYLGPHFGGFVALSELAELRLIGDAPNRQWRLRTIDGQVLLLPVAAKGADKLYDAFAALPAIDMALLSHALAQGTATAVLWRRGQSDAPGRMARLGGHHE